MADHPNAESGSDVPVVPCRHLRSKGMYIYTDGQDHSHEGYDNTIYWCLRSMKGFGPDDEMVDREACCDNQRPCYEPL